MKFKMNQNVAFDVQINIIYIYLYYMNNSRILTNNNYMKETRRKEIFVLKNVTRFYVSFCILVKQIRREKVRKKFCNKSSLLKYLLQMYTICSVFTKYTNNNYKGREHFHNKRPFLPLILYFENNRKRRIPIPKNTTSLYLILRSIKTIKKEKFPLQELTIFRILYSFTIVKENNSWPNSVFH